MTFRFESLLRLRKNAENLEQRAMAEMQNHLYARQNELQDLNSSDTKNKDELQTRLQQTLRLAVQRDCRPLLGKGMMLLPENLSCISKIRWIRTLSAYLRTCCRTYARLSLVISLNRRRSSGVSGSHSISLMNRDSAGNTCRLKPS